jgi:PAS domain S-box-containing protein
MEGLNRTGILEDAPASEAPAAPDGSHSVHLYEVEATFVEHLGQFVGTALGAGGSCLVVATRDHRQLLSDHLSECGFDLPSAVRMGRYLALDAREILDQFLIEAWPDAELFERTIEPLLAQVESGLARRDGPVAVFGEMVALLWAEGKTEAAIRLEQLWNLLRARHNFLLRCGYPMGCFADQSHSELFRRVCAEHGEIIPGESYTSIDSEAERMSFVSSLQQKAQAAESLAEERDLVVAQRRQTEERLRRTEEFARQVLENSVDCVNVLDPDGRLEYMSPPGQRAMSIVDASQVLGRNWLDFWAEEDRPRARAAIDAAKNVQVGSFQGDCETADGIVKSWDVRITPVLGAQGEVERLVAISRDMTELKWAQKALLDAEKLAAAGRLAATIAHEINNPLEAVTNYIYLARTNPDLPEEVSRHLEIADQELARVAQIAQQTLGFYRDNARDRWFSVAELIREVLTIFERKLHYKGLKAEILVDGALKLYGKQGELKQALSNLIANAIDASKEGGKLWLRAHPTRNWTGGMEKGIRVTLADNGCGMSPDVQRRIFAPFFTTKVDIGTGIGLWVTKGLVEKHGGYLRFRSRQGERSGTVMSLFLPGIDE